MNQNENISPRSGAPKTLTNAWLENARHISFMNWVLLTDDFVAFPGPRAQNLGAPDLLIDGFNQLGYRFTLSQRNHEMVNVGLRATVSAATLSTQVEVFGDEDLGNVQPIAI